MERHTRQGTPVRERTQMGDHLDDDPRDWKPKGRQHGGSAQRLRLISASPMCWCFGELCSPDPNRPGWTTWPGRDDGAPHPRST